MICKAHPGKNNMEAQNEGFEDDYTSFQTGNVQVGIRYCLFFWRVYVYIYAYIHYLLIYRLYTVYLEYKKIHCLSSTSLSPFFPHILLVKSAGFTLLGHCLGGIRTHTCHVSTFNSRRYLMKP